MMIAFKRNQTKENDEKPSKKYEMFYCIFIKLQILISNF